MRVAPLVLACFASGCTAFSLPRPAHVQPGPSVDFSLVAATPPGDAPSWFYSVYCVANCNRAMFAPAMSLMYGATDSAGIGVFEVGAGSGGLHPYIELYRPFNPRSARVAGIGARVGLPLHGMEHQLYARMNLRRSGGRTVFINPSLFHKMDIRRDQSFTVFSAVLGLHEDESRSATTLSLAPSIGYTRRNEFADPDEQRHLGVFLVLSATYSVHREREIEGGPEAP